MSQEMNAYHDVELPSRRAELTLVDGVRVGLDLRLSVDDEALRSIERFRDDVRNLVRIVTVRIRRGLDEKSVGIKGGRTPKSRASLEGGQNDGGRASAQRLSLSLHLR